MVKIIQIKITFAGEGLAKEYIRHFDNFGQSDFPTIKEVVDEANLMLKRLNSDYSTPGLSDL